METAVVFLQALSGVLWLLPAFYLSPRVVASWRRNATLIEMVSAPIAFLAWLMVGFSVRWLAWPHAKVMMETSEMVTWAALYALSGFLALWFLRCAYQTKGR